MRIFRAPCLCLDRAPGDEVTGLRPPGGGVPSLGAFGGTPILAPDEKRWGFAKESHVGTHGVGFRIDAPQDWIDQNAEIWEGYADQVEYVIHNSQFGELNQFPRSPWTPGTK